MNSSSDHQTATKAESSKPRSTGRWILLGLLLGLAAGVLFGEYCAPLEVVGQAYVGLLQMTVLPYLTISLIAKTGRLDLAQARRMGLTAIAVLLIFWLVGILLVVGMSTILPPIEGAAFFSPQSENVVADRYNLLDEFIPENVFHSLSNGVVPAVVVFCLFFGSALILVPGKEPLLDFLDLCVAGIGRINVLLVRVAPIGLFALTAAAAGTMRLEQLSRLQAYLIMFALACVATAIGVLPVLLSGVTRIRCRDLLRAAQEPMFTAIATGKLFVVLPQIVEKCDQLLAREDGSQVESHRSTASVVVPLAYPFPHIGKILAFLFISFAAWYTGHKLSTSDTAVVAATGAVSSFASPLVTMPFLLDQFKLPQDLMALFILPGFITTRLADVVGVLHLMTLTLIINEAINRRLQIRWLRLAGGLFAIWICMAAACGASRWYLASTAVQYDLDDRLLSLSIPNAHDDVVVYRSRDELPNRSRNTASALDHLDSDKTLRVGFHEGHLPYSFFNRKKELVGMDIELMHRLAKRLQVRLEFVPYAYDTVVEQLESGEIDVAVGGLMMTPERSLRAGFSESYETATLSVVMPDHRRDEFETWDDPNMPKAASLAVVHEDLAVAARRYLPGIEIVTIDSYRSFFESKGDDLDGLIIAAEEGAAWNVLHPEYAVVVPRPVVQRPVGMAVRRADSEWLRVINGWLEFERLEGSLNRLRTYWVEGGGTQERQPRWCVMRDLLHWLP